jgi:hypothetical protein
MKFKIQNGRIVFKIILNERELYVKIHYAITDAKG